MKKKNYQKNATGDNITASRSNWSFGGKVPETFDSHIKKSVPLYDLVHDLCLKYSDFFIRDGINIYDIGSSTGTLIDKIYNRNIKKKFQITGIDNQLAMNKKAKLTNKKNKNITFIHGDVLDIELKTSSLFFSLFTLQFIHPSRRQNLYSKIFENLEWGGGLIFFEKVRGPDARFQDMLNIIYSEYKIEAGYNEKEILNKSLSLKGVMEPFTSQENLNFCKRAGFKDIMLIFKFLCFEGYLAIK